MILDFKKNDIVSKKEEQIRQIINRPGILNTDLNKIARYIEKTEDIYCVMTLMSIFFKERSRAMFFKEKFYLSEQDEQFTIDIAEELIAAMLLKLYNNDYTKIKRMILENADMIDTLIIRYYSAKNTNYIFNQMPLELIKKQSQQKDALYINPFMINQIMNNEQTPLTKEEQIIYELLEYLIEAEQYFSGFEKMGYIRKLLNDNNSNKDIENKIRFIISNTYQEAKEHPQDEDSSNIIIPIENPNISSEQVTNYFKINKEYSNMILKKFFEYNINIYEGRLKELEEKPSSKYAKKIYIKNP